MVRHSQDVRRRRLSGNVTSDGTCDSGRWGRRRRQDRGSGDGRHLHGRRRRTDLLEVVELGSFWLGSFFGLSNLSNVKLKKSKFHLRSYASEKVRSPSLFLPCLLFR
jgi:hypothetical protein